MLYTTLHRHLPGRQSHQCLLPHHQLPEGEQPRRLSRGCQASTCRLGSTTGLEGRNHSSLARDTARRPPRPLCNPTAGAETTTYRLEQATARCTPAAAAEQEERSSGTSITSIAITPLLDRVAQRTARGGATRPIRPTLPLTLSRRTKPAGRESVPSAWSLAMQATLVPLPTFNRTIQVSAAVCNNRLSHRHRL